MPRLAYLLKRSPRAADGFVLDELLAQEALGRTLVVFSRRGPDEGAPHPKLGRLKAAIEILPPSRENDLWAALFDKEKADEPVFAAAGRLVRDTQEWRHPRFGPLLAEALWLQRRCAQLDVQHVHTPDATDSAVTAMLLRELGGPSYSITARGQDVGGSALDLVLSNRVFVRAELVVTACDANVVHLESLLAAEGTARVRRLYDGVDLQAFRAAGDGAASRDEDHVLGFGRLTVRKGIDVFVDAVALLHERRRDLRATWIGDGEDRPAVEARIAERGLAPVLRVTGALPEDEVRAALARATVFCLPRTVGPDEDREPVPTILIEALAAGVPVVATPVTGIAEILDYGRCGALVPENDAEATARAIAALFDAPERRERIAAAGRAHAAESFDLDRRSRILAGWFDEILERGAATVVSPA